jgi:hypothetical protein|tara:strand:+ start:3122 stop:3346 length:225 start_codon:yes stop_codon:yes gene_type:complete
MKRRNSSTIPFGYKLQEDGVHLEEIQEELKALNKVVPLVKNKVLSLREGAMWLEYDTGRSISHTGLKKIADKYE